MYSTNLLQDHIFAPDASSMYGKNHCTYVDPEGFDEISEGLVRPGHFRGVATIVTKLFNIIQPTNAYFGQKDAAQCVLIQRIVEDLDMDLNVVVKETVREPDGLAMSSRNAYLSAEERQASPILFRSLNKAKLLYEQMELGNTLPSSDLRRAVEESLKTEPLVREIQYVSVDNKATMRAIDCVRKGEGCIISLAVKVGAVRLIDNIVL